MYKETCKTTKFIDFVNFKIKKKTICIYLSGVPPQNR